MKSEALRKMIIKHLIDKGTYDPDVDDIIIVDLIINYEMAQDCLKKIKEDGPVIMRENVNGKLTPIINPYMSAYQMIMRNVFQMISKLGISRSDRIKLRLKEEFVEEKDKFLELLNE